MFNKRLFLTKRRRRSNRFLNLKTLVESLNPVSGLSMSRRLSSSADKLMRVRLGSDNSELDIGFKNNVLDTQALIDFGGYNLLGYTEDLTQSLNIERVTVTANQTANPFNNITSADQVIVDDTNGFHRINKNSIQIISAGKYNFSIYAKANQITKIGLLGSLGSGTFKYRVFDLVNATASSDGQIEDVGNGWYRCSLPLDAVPTTNGGVTVELLTANSGRTYLGNLSDSVFLWGMQLTKGSNLLPYQPRLQGGASDCFVTTWYDQIGSNHATQTVATNQPKIYDVLTGDVTRENGKPAMLFDGTDDNLSIPNSQSLFTGLHKHNEFGEFFGLFAPDTVQNTANAHVFSSVTGGGSTGYATVYRFSGNPFIRSIIFRGVGGTNSMITNDFTPNDGLQKLYNAIVGDTFSEKTNNVNGLTNASYNNQRSSSNATFDFRIGANGVSGDNYKGGIQELIIFNKNLTSEENNTLHNDINDHYSIF